MNCESFTPEVKTDHSQEKKMYPATMGETVMCPNQMATS